MTTQVIDIQVQNEGSIFLLHPRTEAAQEWLDENVSDSAQRFGCALVVEHRYVEDIVAGMIDAGLVVA